MPTDLEIAEYATSLPQIYRDILESYPAVDPRRKAGYGLAFQTLFIHFVNNRRAYGFGEIQDACRRLAESGFLEIKNGIFAHPTPLGERLIAAVAGVPVAPQPEVPQLPARTW